MLGLYVCMHGVYARTFCMLCLYVWYVVYVRNVCTHVCNVCVYSCNVRSMCVCLIRYVMCACYVMFAKFCFVRTLCGVCMYVCMYFVYVCNVNMYACLYVISVCMYVYMICYAT